MLGCLLVLLLSRTAVTEPQLALTAQKVTVTGLSEETLSLLRKADGVGDGVRVYFDRDSITNIGDRPTMMGRWHVADAALVFEARFPFSAGYPHLLVVQPRPGMPARSWVFSRPAAPKPPPAKLVGIFPNSGEVPANLLRWYLFFDRPMAHGFAYQKIRIEDQNGRTLPSPFVVVPEELWDPSRRRLTLFLDPGRIKRGVGPRLQHGVPLQADRDYVLVVDGTWPDRFGSPLGEEMRYAFHVGEEDHRSPRREDWRLVVPAAGETAPFQVHFDEALDREQARRFLTVVNHGGLPVEGTWRIQADGRAAAFLPRQPWQSGVYRLDIASRLEDLAGNHLIAPFDHALEQGRVGVAEHQTFSRRFEIP